MNVNLKENFSFVNRMNNLTIFCEHSSESTLDNIKNIVEYSRINNLTFLNPDMLADFFNDRVGGNFVLLTFDDGQEYKYNNISDSLRKNKIKAIAFVVPIHFGFHNLYTDFDYYIRNKDVFEVGSHTLTHTMVMNSLEYDGLDITSPKMVYYGNNVLKGTYNYGLIDKEYNMLKKRKETGREYNERVNLEIRYSKEWIERAMGVECRFFSYPYGVYNDLIVKKIKKARYNMAFTMNRTNKSLFTIPRIDVTHINDELTKHIIGDVIVNARERLSQNDIDMKHGVFK